MKFAEHMALNRQPRRCPHIVYRRFAARGSQNKRSRNPVAKPIATDMATSMAETEIRMESESCPLMIRRFLAIPTALTKAPPYPPSTRLASATEDSAAVWKATVRVLPGDEADTTRRISPRRASRFP